MWYTCSMAGKGQGSWAQYLRALLNTSVSGTQDFSPIRVSDAGTILPMLQRTGGESTGFAACKWQV